MPTLYDHLNRPVNTADLNRELAAPSLTGVRTIWDETVASGLTPSRLASLLRESVTCDSRDYLTLAEEMEERDLHYACELGKRKLAVSRLPLTVEAYSDSADDKRLADEVRALVRRPGFRGLLKDLLDGLGKGYSPVELMWDRSGSTWRPGAYIHRDPRFFQFDRVTRSELRLRDEADLTNGLALAPYKFIVHIPKLKTGIPIRNGLARLAAWAWMFKNYSVKDWMAFAEVYGMPLRIGRYQATDKPADIAILKMAVANLGTDAAAVIPDSMRIELVERKTTGGSDSLYKIMADWFDAQVSRGILGQTATTQGTPGKLGGDEAQSQVRDDIRDDDAEQLAETLNRDLVVPYIDLNWGPQENYPQLVLRAVEREDISAISDSLAKLVPLGLKIEQSVVRDRLGWPDPSPSAKPEDLLGAAPAPGPPPGLNRALNSSGLPATGAAQTSDPYPPELIAGRLADEAQPQVEDWLATIRAMLDQADSLPQFKEMLLSAFDDLPADQLAQVMGSATLAAQLAGRFDAEQGNG